MVRDWEKIFYGFARPNNLNLFLMPKGRLRDDLIAAYYHLHGEKILPFLNLAGKSRIRAHRWKLEPVEMRHKILARMVVHWNNCFPKDVLRENKSLQVSNPEYLYLAGPGLLGSVQMCTGQSWWPEAVGIYQLLDQTDGPSKTLFFTLDDFLDPSLPRK